MSITWRARWRSAYPPDRTAKQPMADSGTISSSLLIAAIRRAIDVLVAVTGLAIAAPPSIVIALAIRLETPGPVFFSQIRLGRMGRRFVLYKFRKFRHESETSGRMVTLKDDPRMTRVGQVLERTKLDELPQLWNVLIGDMSIVGPRPESLEFADCFIGPFRHLLDYNPGLFGPSQVAFRNEGALYPPDHDPHEFYRTVLFPDKARIDLEYFPRRTLLSDLIWVLRSIAAVLSPSKPPAQGISTALRVPGDRSIRRRSMAANQADKV